MHRKCIECGGELELRKFIDGWDAEGKPMDINEDYYCPKCDIRWLREDGPHNFYERDPKCVWCDEELIFLQGKGWVHKSDKQLYKKRPDGSDDHCALPKFNEY